MTRTKYQKRMLAGAVDAEGKPVHKGLRLQCSCSFAVPPLHDLSLSEVTRRRENFHRLSELDDVSVCREWCGFIPNTNPMALVAAAWAQNWTVNFEAGDSINVYVAEHEEKVTCYMSDVEKWDEVPAALTDAVFQATESLAANWGGCGCCRIGDQHVSSECSHCYYTGKVLKED